MRRQMHDIPFKLASILVIAAVGNVLFLVAAFAVTRVDLSDRMVIDGYAGEWEGDESLFGTNPSTGLPEESPSDSKWGPFNDVAQIKITWDARNLYVAVEGIIFSNNVMLLIDSLPMREGAVFGLSSLSALNAWRRAADFGNNFYPDVFLATWDDNTVPQLWYVTQNGSVRQVGNGQFRSAATFSRDLSGRAMEAAIPWDFVCFGMGWQVFVPTYGDSVYLLPPEITQIRILAWVTTGADGYGGPDCAPDNSAGLSVDAASLALLDNFAIVHLDADQDGFPDFDVSVKERTSFFAQPPLVSVRELTWGALKHLYQSN